MKSPISGSKLAVGSSKRSISGSLINDLARETRFFCPEESSPVFLSKKFLISKSLEMSSILFFKFLIPYNLPYISRFCLTVSFLGSSTYGEAKLNFFKISSLL